MKFVFTTSTPTVADVNQTTPEPTARQRLMIVMGPFVRMVEPVKIESMLSHVTALMDLQGTCVKQILMTVME